MAVTVSVKAVGGKLQLMADVETVADIKGRLGLKNYIATVNSEPQDDSFELEEGAFVTLTENTKGA